MKSKDSNSKKSMSYQKKDGSGHAHPSFLWYDNDKDLKVCFSRDARHISCVEFDDCWVREPVIHSRSRNFMSDILMGCFRSYRSLSGSRECDLPELLLPTL